MKKIVKISSSKTWSLKGVEERLQEKGFAIIEILKKSHKLKYCRKENMMSKSGYLILFFEDFYKILEDLCKEWILWKILRDGENLIWKHFENFRAILDKW